jgi:general secretion pathway protein J
VSVRIDAQLAGPVPWPLQSIDLRLDLSSEARTL